MNRMQFFRTLMAAIGATKAGKTFSEKVPTPVVDTPWSPYSMLWPDKKELWTTISIPRGKLNVGDLFLSSNGSKSIEFFVGERNEQGNLIAISTKSLLDSRSNEDVTIKLIIDEGDTWEYNNDRVTKIGNAFIESDERSISPSDTEVYPQ